jgi:hypothetical protein
VSYQVSHSEGLLGAVAETIGQGNVFEMLLLASILIQVEAVSVSCLLDKSLNLAILFVQLASVNQNVSVVTIQLLSVVLVIAFQFNAKSTSTFHIEASRFNLSASSVEV